MNTWSYSWALLHILPLRHESCKWAESLHAGSDEVLEKEVWLIVVTCTSTSTLTHSVGRPCSRPDSRSPVETKSSTLVEDRWQVRNRPEADFLQEVILQKKQGRQSGTDLYVYDTRWRHPNLRYGIFDSRSCTSASHSTFSSHCRGKKWHLLYSICPAFWDSGRANSM